MLGDLDNIANVFRHINTEPIVLTLALLNFPEAQSASELRRGLVEKIRDCQADEIESLVRKNITNRRYTDGISLKVREIIDYSDIWLPKSSTITGYCKTFSDAGIVEAIHNCEGVSNNYYALSIEGNEKYQPFALFALRESVDIGQSLSFLEVLGKRGSKGETEAISNRLGILRELYEKELSQNELCKSLDLKYNTLENNLETLILRGLVDKPVKSPRRNSFSFVEGRYAELSDKERTPLVKKIMKLVDMRKFTNRELITALGVEYNERTIRRNVTKLVDQGYVKKVDVYKNGTKYKLSLKGSSVFENIVMPSNDAIGNRKEMKNVLDKGRLFFEQQPEVLPRYFVNAMLLYNQASPYLNQRSSAENCLEIIRALEENPGVGQKELMRMTGIKRLSHYLAELRKAEMVKRGEKDSGRVPYYVTDKAVGHFKL